MIMKPGKKSLVLKCTTWRRTVEKECRQEGWVSWAKANRMAQGRAGWRAKVAALCTPGAGRTN